jgi:mitofilin
LRSIKAQVESERGGRLAKLDNLTSSFKQLERITLDNSSQLDANVSLHTLWSALRAVQAKADKGGVAFDDELRVLKNAAAAATAGKDDETANVIQTMIDSIETSGAAVEGVKSLPSLSGWFSNTLLPKIQSVSLVPAEHEAGVLSHVASALLSKVLFTRKAGFVQGDDVGAVLARAEYYLGEKNLEMAARELNQLQGWAGKLASDWLREARKRLTVEQALQVGDCMHQRLVERAELTRMWRRIVTSGGSDGGYVELAAFGMRRRRRDGERRTCGRLGMARA